MFGTAGPSYAAMSSSPGDFFGDFLADNNASRSTFLARASSLAPTPKASAKMLSFSIASGVDGGVRYLSQVGSIARMSSTAPRHTISLAARSLNLANFFRPIAPHVLDSASCLRNNVWKVSTTPWSSTSSSAVWFEAHARRTRKSPQTIACDKTGSFFLPSSP